MSNEKSNITKNKFLTSIPFHLKKKEIEERD